AAGGGECEGGGVLQCLRLRRSGAGGRRTGGLCDRAGGASGAAATEFVADRREDGGAGTRGVDAVEPDFAARQLGVDGAGRPARRLAAGGGEPGGIAEGGGYDHRGLVCAAAAAAGGSPAGVG